MHLIRNFANHIKKMLGVLLLILIAVTMAVPEKTEK